MIVEGLEDEEKLESSFEWIEKVMKDKWGEEILNGRIGKLSEMKEFLEDRKRKEEMMVELRMREGKEGVEDLEEVDKKVIEKFLKRKIEMKWREKEIVK